MSDVFYCFCSVFMASKGASVLRAARCYLLLKNSCSPRWLYTERQGASTRARPSWKIPFAVQLNGESGISGSSSART